MKQLTSAFILLFLLGCGGGSESSKDSTDTNNGSATGTQVDPLADQGGIKLC
ncbi:hypothetical protein GCM10011607_42760 [Shewanella inventionis]|uniref:Lipoprotein n=1 Tax=Shewanella inventionis TaxID=1738770 RepID=A0ABQ1JXA4_9GAMM|nr:hypothetical protein GCM10011607_42760 [Shewanella inventionis]